VHVAVLHLHFDGFTRKDEGNEDNAAIDAGHGVAAINPLVNTYFMIDFV
jgi:hypothetical protein